MARERLSVYLPMRELTMRFVSKCVMPLCTDEIFNSAAERIGIARGDSISEDSMATLSAVIGDYAVMMNDKLGIPPIKRVIADADKFTGDIPIQLSFSDQARFAAETIRRIHTLGRYSSIKYGGLADLND